MDTEARENSRKYVKYAIFCIIGLIILIALLSCGNKYSKMEKEMINKSKNYFKYSVNYVTLNDMNLKYDNCRSYSGVYRVSNNYIPYLFCDDYTSSKEELMSKNITLFGSNPTVLKVGEEFNDPGYASKYSIEVINNVGENEGLYFVRYIAKNNDQPVDEIKRLVIVKGFSNDSFILKGDQEIHLFKGEPYFEPGYIARDEVGNDISSYVSVSGKVNNKVSGKYELTYSLDKGNIKKELRRTVKVLDVSPYLELETTKPSTKTNTISLIIAGSDYTYTILPDGKTSSSREIEYPAESNGTYNFKVYAGDKYILKSITVSNIYKPVVASCTITQGSNQVFVNVDATGGYGELEYSYLDKDSYSAYTSEKTYFLKNQVKETTVKIKDGAGNIVTTSCSNSSIKIPKLEIHFIANGHYDDAILIRTNFKTILIDGGRSGCKDYVINYLKELGVTKIDYMIGSHIDYDHIQTQAYILDTFEVNRILYPIDIYNCLSNCQCSDPADNELVLESLERNNKAAETVEIPSRIAAGDMTMYFIAPWKKVCNNNNNSFIFILTYGNNSFMFTGDTYSPLESINTLTSYANELGLKNLDVDMFKYPHHGNNPMSNKILEAIKPEIVVVPNYHASKYPTESNQAIIKNFGAKLYRQSDSSTGNITLTSDGYNIEVHMNSVASTYKR